MGENVRKKKKIKSIDNPPPLRIELKSGDDNSQFAENIINTVREPLIVLDHELKVVTASRSFYNFFKVNIDETIGKLIYDLGNKQWNIPKLRELLETILPEKTNFDNYEVEHKFSTIGKRIMLLNARQIERAFGKEKIILLAIEDVTERRHKEKKLSEKNRMTSEYLDILLDHAHAPIIIWDSSLIIKRFNHEFEKLSGYSSSEVIDKKIEILFPKDKIDLTLELIKNNISDDKSEILDIDILTKDKDVKTVLWNSSNIFDKEGNKIVATIAQDITRYRLTEEALSASEAKTRTILEAISTGIIIVDPETNTIEDVNSEAVRLIGEKKENIVGSICHKYICSAETEKCPITKLGQKIDNSEHVLINKEGKRIPILKTVTQINLGGRKLLLENFTDITERIHTEETLRESEATLDEAMKIARLGTWEYDVAQDQFKFNDQFYKLLHTTVEHESGYFMPSMQYAQKFVHPDDMVLVRAEIKKALETTDPNYISRLDHRIIYSDGKTGYFNVNIRILKDSQGRTVKTYGVNQDITEGKRAEEKIRDLAKFPSENPFPVLRIAKNGTLLYVNETGLKQLPEWNLQTEHTVPNMLMDVVSNTLNNGEMQEVEFNHSEKIYSFYIIPFVESEYVNLYGRDITERVMVDKILKKNEKRFIELFDNAPVGYHELDINGCITRINQTEMNLLDYSPEEMVGQFAWKFAGDEIKSRQRVIDKLKGILPPAKGEEIIYRRKDQTTFSGLVEENILYDSENNITGIRTTIQDISKLKNAENELRKLSKAIEQSPVSVVITNPNGDIEYVNEKFCRLTGYLLEEVIGKNTCILKSGRQDNKFYEELWKTILSGKEWKGEILNKKKNGELYWESSLISPLHNNNGDITQFIAIKEDITEQKKIRSELLISEGRYNAIFNTSLELVYIFDFEGQILEVNDQALNLFGYTLEESKSLKLSNILDPADLTIAFNNIGYVVANGVNQAPQEYKLRTKKGREIFIETTAVRLDRDGKPHAIMGIARDITERKHTEKVMIEAKEKAEEMNRLKTNFLANMSHELRTPMIGILGYAELLENELTDNDLIEMVKIIKLSGQRLSKTLNNILNISKIETRKQQINITKHDLIRCLVEQVKLFKAAAEIKGLSLNIETKEEILNAYIDEELFISIINNLLNNAIKYTNTGGITLIAKQQEGAAIIEVIDTGIGVPEKFQSLIFEEFRQVSEGYNRNFDGTGLGLTIAKKYTELMGGTIVLKNNLNEISSGLPADIHSKATGSTFVLTLPANENTTENLISTNWS